MKVLLTGGAGFIGSSMLWRLNYEGIKDIIVTDHLGESEKWKNLNGKYFEDYFEKDKLFDYIEKGLLKDKVDTVIHFGACTSTTEQDATYMMENNYVYTKNNGKHSYERSFIHFRPPFLRILFSKDSLNISN